MFQLCDLKSLEILDLGRNRLRVLPPDIVKLSSLKVFAVQKNMISELPLCLADMASLQVLKLDGNPITSPPLELMQIQAASPPNEGFLKEREVTEVTVTAHIKKFLKQRAAALNGRAEGDTTGDSSSEGTETPRPPIKRVMSGRFPIKLPNGSDVPDILRSPNISRPPPIPTRSHYRGLSQQNTRRPGVMPLTIGNVNERVRSNSETLLQASRAERPESRSRRMGIVSKKASELGTLDETRANNRFSHYRGLSHGSAMQGPSASMAAKSPASPAEQFLQRPIYVRRLSVLPERRGESKILDPVLEAAKGILYSVFQIHPMIQMLLSLTNDGTAKRSSLELVFYNTNAHVEELELEIQKHDPLLQDGYGPQENENVQSACVTLVNAYAHVCSLLASNVDMFIDNGDPRYIRTLLTQLYNSIMELRVTCTQVTPEDGYRMVVSRAALGDTIRPYPREISRGNSRDHSRDNSRDNSRENDRENARENAITPTAERPGLNNFRARNGTFVHNPSNLRVATDVPVPYINGMGRTATITSATPRSGESFTSPNASSGRLVSSDFSDEDRLFERIFLSLQKSSELVIRTLPNLNVQFADALRSAIAQRAPEETIRRWKILVAECSTAIQQTETVKSRLSLIKLKEPGIRTQPTFWTICKRFLESWASLGTQMKWSMHVVSLPFDIRTRLRPIQQSIKETTALISTSPWSDFFPRHPSNGHSIMSPDGSQSGNPFPLPMTPQSAALGPAVQATVPSTPQSASFSSAFSGNVFERADNLISMGGLSMSRTGTMTSTSTTLISSSTSSSQDGTMTPSSMLSPESGSGSLGPLPFRLNNGSKDAF